MNYFSLFLQRMFGLCIMVIMLAWAGPGHTALDDLEGTHGHEQPSSLDGLEGTHGHDDPGQLPGTDALQGQAPDNFAAGQDGPTGTSPTLDDGIACTPGAPCTETSTQQPLRLLPRPFSNMYTNPEANQDGIVLANVPAFKPLYVFDRQDLDLSQPDDPQGWYQVGRTSTAPDGWMQAKDVLEWRQALLVSYTHPGNELEGRSPVLMFRERNNLESIVDDFDMTTRAKALYDDLGAGNVPAEIISMEPKRFVDITTKFYVLPILQWSQTQIDGDDVRLLQVAAAVPGARGADTMQSDEYSQAAMVGRDQGDATDVKVDVVFVVDTTRSMQPFIDMTRDAVAQMSKKFSATTADRFRFGLVVFRDSLEVAPKLDYVTRNLTPELVSAERLAALLDEEGGATEVGSVDYAEEAFAGVDVALHSQWREGALRFVILLGDASSHPKGHKQNTTGKDETDLRREYDDAQVHLLAIHLQDPRAAEDHALAQAQFGHLARVRGDESTSALLTVNAEEEEEYRALVEHLTSRINARLNETLGTVATTETGMAATDETAPLDEFDKLWEASLIEYVGKEANPPKDIVAWVMDRDLLNPADRSLDVRVLVTRDQLSTLAQTLDQVVQAVMRAEVTQGQFFEALQGVAGQAMKRPEDLGAGANLAEAGLLPAFIQSLPYKSDILALTNDMFASMTAEQRSQLEWSILAKLDQYRTINEQVDAWFRVNDTDPDQDMVYPLHLDYLP